jgi:hypothetical protein
LIAAAYPGASPDRVSIIFDSNVTRAIHQDNYNGSRALLLLCGIKEIEFNHLPFLARTEMTQFPGDAYKMRFRADETSILHEIDPLEILNIAMYVQETED